MFTTLLSMPPERTLNDLCATFPGRGARTAVSCGRRRATYGELHERSRRLAATILAMAPRTGAYIGILFPNDDRFVTSFVAVTRIGCVAAPISGRRPPTGAVVAR